MREAEFPRVPEDPDCERALLTTLCAGPENPEVPDCLRLLNGGEPFLVPKHQAIYLAFRALWERQEEIGPVAIKAECEAQGTLAKVGGYTGIFEMLDAREEVLHPLVLARRLQEIWQRRQLQLLGSRLVREAGDATVETADLVRALQEASTTPRAGHRVLQVTGAGEWLDSPAPEPRWLIPGMMLLGVPSVMASKGGLGKSFLALQMCIALAAGKGFLDFEALAPMATVYFGLEDSRDTVHRRFRSIVDWHKAAGTWSDQDDAALRRNSTCLFVDWRAPGATSYLPVLAGEIEALLEANLAAGIPPGLVVVDTLARVSDGDENQVEALRPILNACARLADHGYTPLLLHHVGKGQDGARAGKDKPTVADRMSTEWVRGSSAIVDNFRCILQLAQVREDEAESAGLDAERARTGQYLIFGATKVNGAPKGDMRLLEQDEHGRWAPLADGAEALARLRGRRAVAALTKQVELLYELYQATRWGGEPKKDELAKRLAPPDSKDPIHWFRTTLYRLRNSGFIQKNSYQLTVQGLQHIKGVTEGRSSNEQPA